MVTLNGQGRRLRRQADLIAPRRSRHEQPSLRPELALQLAKQNLQYSNDVLEDRVRAVYYPLKAQVRRHPFGALMVAFGVGAVVGSITDRRDLKAFAQLVKGVFPLGACLNGYIRVSGRTRETSGSL